MDTSAQTLAIGAGTVGCSATHHLARLGNTDVAVVDQGSPFATGGSSSHGPGLVSQTKGSQMLTQFTANTVQCASREVDSPPGFHQVGGVDAAATREPWDELHRKQGLATAWGLDGGLDVPSVIAARCWIRR